MSNRGIWVIPFHGCPRQCQLALVGFAFRSEAEEGAAETQPWSAAGTAVYFGQA